MTDQDREIARLHRRRPRSAFVRWSAAGSLGLVAVAWADPALWGAEILSPRRLENLRRFLGEIVPYPLQGQHFDGAVAFRWAMDILRDKGWEALEVTLALSVAAIVLAAGTALVLALAAARTLANPEPYVPSPRPAGPVARWWWRSGVTGSRAALIVIRSLPEYVWAFLLLAILGPSPWAIVLALALHNLGILGRLNAEVIEDLDPQPLAALRGLGASRTQLAVTGIFPLALPRFLLYFFYRWETCVREATVLGMLGVSSLGYWIVDARARNHYDTLVFLVLLGAVLVLLGDIVSAVARAMIRRS